MDDFFEFAIKTIRAGNTPSISSTDASTHFLHIHAPIMYDDPRGKPTEIVGSASNVQGEFRMVKILIKNLKFFPIMGVSLPCDSQVATSLTTKELVGTPLKGEDEVFGSFMNTRGYIFTTA